MTVYTLTHLTALWHIHRYDEEADHIFTVRTNIPNEEEAVKLALLEAQRHRPSEVKAIGASGITCEIARFN